MGRQDSYENALATIEQSRRINSENKANREVLERLAKVKEQEIAAIADVERRKIAAEVEKEQIKTSERIKSKFF